MMHCCHWVETGITKDIRAMRWAQFFDAFSAVLSGADYGTWLPAAFLPMSSMQIKTNYSKTLVIFLVRNPFMQYPAGSRF